MFVYLKQPILSRAALRHDPHEKEEYRCILCVFCACPSRGSELNSYYWYEYSGSSIREAVIETAADRLEP